MPNTIRKGGKMIPISSQQTYTELLIQYQPRPIKTEEEYQRALATVEGMMSRKLTEPETALFELLVLLIEIYEEQYYPMGKSPPNATLESLMHEFDVEQAALVEIFGSLELVREVINSQRGISKSEALALAKFFNNLSQGLSLKAKDFEE